MKREKTWRERQIDMLHWDFGLYAELFEDEHDDRRVFANNYYQMIEAIESLPQEPPAWVCVAISHHMEDESEWMRRIIDKYCHGLWGEPVKFHLSDKEKRWPGILSKKITV